MIVRDFNNGWGDDVELRAFEKSILQRYLRSWYQDDSQCVTISSTWYSQDYHDQVLLQLARDPPDKIALYSFLDPAIPRPEWFQEFDCEIHCIGYYPGPHAIDAWALIMDQYFQHQQSNCSGDGIDTPFLCYNRKPHWHRQRLIQQMAKQGCLDHGIVTMGDADGSPRIHGTYLFTGSSIAPNAGVEQYGIPNDIMSLGPIELWDRCFLNVVTETVFDVDQIGFASEKIYKPIVGMKPFLVYAPNGARLWLDRVGIENFTQDFWDISDWNPADPEHLVLFLKDLIKQPKSYFQTKFLLLEEKIKFNHDRYQNYIKEQKQKVNQGYF
jgi:hypothetical protein